MLSIGSYHNLYQLQAAFGESEPHGIQELPDSDKLSGTSGFSRRDSIQSLDSGFKVPGESASVMEIRELEEQKRESQKQIL
jgi:hypothetical protein